jgi:hypothetical protein
LLLVFGAPCQLRWLAGQEHGRTIPLTDIRFQYNPPQLLLGTVKAIRQCSSDSTCGSAMSVLARAVFGIGLYLGAIGWTWLAGAAS